MEKRSQRNRDKDLAAKTYVTICNGVLVSRQTYDIRDILERAFIAGFDAGYKYQQQQNSKINRLKKWIKKISTRK